MGCKYMVNMNYAVDLARGESGAWAFASARRCSVCAGVILSAELRRAEARSELRRALTAAGVHWVRVPKERARVRRLLASALALLAAAGTVSANTVYDTAYILEARELGATLVTGDRAACKRAIRLGVCCIYTRASPWCEGMHARTVEGVRSPYKRLTEKAIQAAKRGHTEEAAEILTQYLYGEISEREAEKKLRALAEAG